MAENEVVWQKAVAPLWADEGDIWDDRLLIKAYDKAVAELKDDVITKPKKMSRNRKRFTSSQRKKNRKAKKMWEIGCSCLSPYSEDGLFYEATILYLDIEARLAEVQYSYYGNRETVDVDQLIPMEGREAVQEQSEKNLPMKEKKLLENKPHEWRLSDICYYRVSDDDAYMQAILNEIKSPPSTCLITFTLSLCQREVEMSKLITYQSFINLNNLVYQMKTADIRKALRAQSHGQIMLNKPHLTLPPVSKSTPPEDFSKAHEWKVSEICFFCDREGRPYTQAVVNEITSPTTCHITFIYSRRQIVVEMSKLVTHAKLVWLRSQQHISESHAQPKPLFPVGPLSNSKVPANFTAPAYPPFMPIGIQAGRQPGMGADRITPPSIPAFPPPPMVPEKVIAGDEEALANMLMSWYMSGYHTGYYQALQMSKRNSNVRITQDEPKRKQDVTDTVTTDDSEHVGSLLPSSTDETNT